MGKQAPVRSARAEIARSRTRTRCPRHSPLRARGDHPNKVILFMDEIQSAPHMWRSSIADTCVRVAQMSAAPRTRRSPGAHVRAEVEGGVRSAHVEIARSCAESELLRGSPIRVRGDHPTCRRWTSNRYGSAPRTRRSPVHQVVEHEHARVRSAHAEITRTHTCPPDQM